ncbi:MAG: TMEM165/GDT1 family protein, partial [Streptosporangiales bacterium]
MLACLASEGRPGTRGAVCALSETFGRSVTAAAPRPAPGCFCAALPGGPGPLDFAVALTVFAVIFLAELPDKTALASLVLGTRYRPLHVFTGVAAAFTVHVALAITAGSLLALLPHRLLQVLVGALFLLGAVLLRGRRGHGEE